MPKKTKKKVTAKPGEPPTIEMTTGELKAYIKGIVYNYLQETIQMQLKENNFQHEIFECALAEVLTHGHAKARMQPNCKSIMQYYRARQNKLGDQ